MGTYGQGPAHTRLFFSRNKGERDVSPLTEKVETELDGRFRELTKSEVSQVKFSKPGAGDPDTT